MIQQLLIDALIFNQMIMVTCLILAARRQARQELMVRRIDAGVIALIHVWNLEKQIGQFGLLCPVCERPFPAHTPDELAADMQQYIKDSGRKATTTPIGENDGR